MSTQYMPPPNMLVEIYTKDHCPYCVRALDLIESKNIPCVIIDLQKQPERIAEMLERSSNKRSVPQIFINDLHIGGCDDLYRMNAQGQLDAFTTPL